MNEKQFDLILDLMSHDPKSPANVAARKVLFGGAKSVAVAGQEVGITRAAVNKVIVKMRKADERIRNAYLDTSTNSET